MSFDFLGSQESLTAEYCCLIGQEWNCDAQANRIIFSFSSWAPGQQSGQEPCHLQRKMG